MADGQEEGQLFLLPCSICSRTFRSEILPRHEKVCENTHSKKRKAFDSFKCRVQGTDLEEYLGPPPLPGQAVRAPPKPKVPEKSKSPKLPKWKQTHEALIATFRAARGSDVPSSTAPILNVTSNEQCPSCGRHFGPKAYDRHVEFCKELMSRKAREPVKYNPAQERQDARLKYRAPLAIKKSLASMRPAPGQSVLLPSPMSGKRSITTAPVRQATATLKPVRTAASATSVQSQPNSSFNRTGSVRSSLRIRGVSPAKLPPTSAPKRNSSPVKRNININASKSQKSDLNETKIPSDGNQTYNSITLESIMATAQKQMRELMSWSSDSDIAEPSKPNDVTPTLPPLHVTTTPKPSSSLVPSPTSAFIPVTPTNRNESWRPTDSKLSVDENENCQRWSNEDDDGDDDNNAYKMLTSTPKAKPTPAPRTPATLRKSLPNDCEDRRLSRTSLAEEGVLWPSLEKVQPPLERSRKKTFARSTSVFEDRNRMLFLQTYEATSSDEELDGKGQERWRGSSPLFSNNLRSSDRRPSSPPDLEIIRGGGDSAYSSLNRRSPRPQEESQPKRKISKFCHECGSAFPVALAKFCCECGVKRLLI